MEGPFLRRSEPVQDAGAVTIPRGRRTSRPWIAGLGALGLLLSAPAIAGDPPPPPSGTPTDADMKRAKEFFENGQILYDEGRYEDAITAWEQSYRLSGLADLLFNISGAYERLGDYKDALSALNKYRAFAPAEERETLDRRIRVIEDRQKQAAENAPKPPVDVVTSPVKPRETVKPPKKAVPVVPIAMTVVGVGVAGFGAVEALRANSAVSSLRSQCVEKASGGLLCPAEAKAASSVRRSAALASVVAIGAGGLLTVGGVVGMVVGGRSSDLRVTPTLGGLAIDGEF
jgi:tetratricopeptide (TPR) repeat protein